MNDLKKYLPGIYKRSQIMHKIMSADEKELDNISDICDSFFKEMLIDSADEKLSDYEKSLCIVPDINATLDERRSNIKSKMRGYGILTAAQLKNIIEAYAKGEVEITEKFSDYKIEVRFVSRLGIPPNMTDVKNAVSDVIPAHLKVEYIFKYNTWQDKKTTTWQSMKTMTWNDVLNKEAENE